MSEDLVAREALIKELGRPFAEYRQFILEEIKQTTELLEKKGEHVRSNGSDLYKEKYNTLLDRLVVARMALEKDKPGVSTMPLIINSLEDARLDYIHYLRNLASTRNAAPRKSGKGDLVRHCLRKHRALAEKEYSIKGVIRQIERDYKEKHGCSLSEDRLPSAATVSQIYKEFCQK